MSRLPHPIPYQGSKRLLASTILSFFPERVETLYEPFAGSAAVSLAASARSLARTVHLNDSFEPLMAIWRAALTSPSVLADQYESLWAAQLGREAEFFIEVRNEFNRDKDPAKLLYLLARCVKNAVRFNKLGEFNQSPDHRRKGMHPAKMREHLIGANALLAPRARLSAGDYASAMQTATSRDLVYFDPPYLGVSGGRDRRYAEALDYDRFLGELEALNERGVPFIVSFDGRCGTKVYAEALPSTLGLRLIEIEVGRSSQATLNGTDDVTVESLYISKGLSQSSMPAMVRIRDVTSQISF